MNKNKEKFDIYQMVTDQIIEILETHENLGYTQTWTPASGELLASNPVSRATYRGFNQIYLAYVAKEEGFAQNRWITLYQGSQLGAKVRKGEHARPVTFWSWVYRDEKTGRNVTTKVKELRSRGKEKPEGVKAIPIFRYYNVFNLEQFEGLPEKLFFRGETIQFTEPEKDHVAEEFIHATRARVEYVRDGGNHYNPVMDYIQLCEREQFRGKEAYYKTCFHELGHWTGHHSRLDRPIRNEFGSSEYAKEELIAEMFSAFTSARCGFSSQITNNAAYIKSWLGVLRSDKRFVVQAASAAQKAADFAGDLAKIEIDQPSAV